MTILLNYASEILKLSKKRYEFIELQNDSYNEETNKYEKEYKEIDSLGKEILDSIKKYKDRLEFDFILIELTKLGHAPNLLYDDNGKFAIEGSGFQTVAFGDEPVDMEMQFFIEAEYWKDTPREALDFYLNH